MSVQELVSESLVEDVAESLLVSKVGFFEQPDLSLNSFDEECSAEDLRTALVTNKASEVV